MNTKLVAVPASSEQKHVSGKHCIQQQHFYHLLITPNYEALFISPDDYDITVNRIENDNVFNVFTFHGSSHQHLFVEESFMVKKSLNFFNHFQS